MYEQGGYTMGEIKTDLFPDRLRAARDRERAEMKESGRNPVKTAEPLPEFTRSQKDEPEDR